MFGNAILDRVEDSTGTIIWASDHDDNRRGELEDRLPEHVRLVNRLMATLEWPHRYLENTEKYGIVELIDKEPFRPGELTERFVMSLTW